MKADKLLEYNKKFDEIRQDVLLIIDKGKKGRISILINHNQGGVGPIELEENTTTKYK